MADFTTGGKGRRTINDKYRRSYERLLEGGNMVGQPRLLYFPSEFLLWLRRRDDKKNPRRRKTETKRIKD